MAYQDWAEELVDHGWKAFLLTFMFRPLGGSAASVARQMENEVERVYATHVTHVNRKPSAPSQVGRLPIWIVAHDWPVFKREKANMRDVILNDGQHVHAVAFDPPWSRLRCPLDEHFAACTAAYIKPDRPLDRVDVRPITHRVGYVVGYARKSDARLPLRDAATLVLPRSQSEL